MQRDLNRILFRGPVAVSVRCTSTTVAPGRHPGWPTLPSCRAGWACRGFSSGDAGSARKVSSRAPPQMYSKHNRGPPISITSAMVAFGITPNMSRLWESVVVLPGSPAGSWGAAPAGGTMESPGGCQPCGRTTGGPPSSLAVGGGPNPNPVFTFPPPISVSRVARSRDCHCQNSLSSQVW